MLNNPPYINLDNVQINLDQRIYTKKSELYYFIHKLKETIGTGTTTNVKVKSGVIPGGSFTGNPKIYDVVFGSSFTGDYSISVIGEDVRVWSYENKVLSGFRINSNADQSIVGNIYWQAILNGEF
jgi:hypothetical protein